MNGIAHISEAASLAMHSMAVMASRNDLTSAGEISARLGASEHHLAKVLQRLAKSGLIRSTRGPRGGFTLALRGDAITLLDVYEAIDGPLGDGVCLLGKKSCKKGGCIMGETLRQMSAMLKKHLGTTRIADIAGAFPSGGRQ